ncbi:DUF1643 domain-containing protein [Bacillus safensis]|uniref:DUF1643 domain-containing protein n=1 Tax=Bacillus safensis TaxID=561879 RepID=UPI0020CD2B86|nr:DUF1643 domain-containing protein [Bacillus safensis]MCP9283538.1 DUF1643 domain-containing protein [Bacillus safensis]
MENNQIIDARYSLKLKTNNDSNNEITFILKNPSHANTQISDATVNKVIDVAYSKGASVINIFNVLPFYLTNANDLPGFVRDLKEQNNDIYKNALLKNISAIEDHLKNISDDTVVCCWGSGLVDIENLNAIEGLVKSSREIVYRVKIKDNFPPHPQRISVDPKNPFEPLNTDW